MKEITDEIKKRYQEMQAKEENLKKEIEKVRAEQRKYIAYLTAEGILEKPKRTRTPKK